MFEIGTNYTYRSVTEPVINTPDEFSLYVAGQYRNGKQIINLTKKKTGDFFVFVMTCSSEGGSYKCVHQGKKEVDYGIDCE